MAKFKVLYTDSGLKDVQIERSILEAADADLIMGSATDEQTLIREGTDCDGVMVEYALITDSVLKAWGEGGRVRIISRQGIGYDNIDVEAATRYGIPVGNVPDYCIDEVADHTTTLALCAWRGVKYFDSKIHRGIFEEKSEQPIYRLRGKKCCLYGFGNIAKQVARRMQAFGMQVVSFDPYVSDEVFSAHGITRADSLEDLARQADIFTIHTPLTKTTRGTVDDHIFRCMKKSCVFVNTSRGAMIDEEALIRALDEKRIAAAGLDVYAEEPLPLDSALRGRDNVVLTSHVAFYSEEAEEELRRKIAENVAVMFSTGQPKYCVNPEVLKG